MHTAQECPVCPPGTHVTTVDHVDNQHPRMGAREAFNLKEWFRRRRLPG